MQALQDVPTKVEEGGQEVVSSLDAYDQVTGRLDTLRKALEKTKQAEVDAASAASTRLQEEIDAASQKVEGFRSEVLDLGSKISALSQTILVDLDDQASEPMKKIQDALDRLQDKTITIDVAYTSTIPSSASPGDQVGSIDNPISGFTGYAIGTSRVPKTGLYQLHAGEEVRNPREASTPSGLTLRVGDINVTVAGGGGDPQRVGEQIGEAAARKLYQKFREYDRRFRVA
jgi:hypothetical protein